MSTYNEFLNTKLVKFKPGGFEVDPNSIHPKLFQFQKDIVIWALRMGRAAVFADCGLGKTFIQLEWARHVAAHTGKPVLIVAPLAVSGQTIQEARKIDYQIEYCRLQADANGVIDNITNYEMLHKFSLRNYGGLVVDESSILKNFTGKTKRLLIKMAQHVAYRLACTATPAPNDATELGNHAEFLGIMKSQIMMRTWFRHNSGDVHNQTLAPHGAKDFWRWVSSWAVSLTKPSDIGNHSNDGYILPELIFKSVVVPVDHKRAWKEVDNNNQLSLLLVGNTSATNMHREKRATRKSRMKMAADKASEVLAKNPDEYVIIWCQYNYEADELCKLLPDAIEVRGNEKLEEKQRKLLAFSSGEFHTLITKPKIAAHGLNWQHAGVQIWTSITHKFEEFYQGYKRSHRFGRIGDVTCHIVYAESEGSILANLERKHREHVLMQHEMIRAMKENGMSVKLNQHLDMLGEWGDYRRGDNWKLYHGDSAITLQNEAANGTDLIVQSPPFKSIFTYSDNVEDLGNCRTDEEFWAQYAFILRDELRRLKPGAIKCEHCQDLPLLKSDTGHEMGLSDFPGELLKAHLQAGFWLVGIKTIWKDPVIEMQRKKVLGLLWSKSFVEKSEYARQGVADYMLVFQKPTENGSKPDTHVIRTPMPCSVVDRCVDLWSMAGENILTPYHKARDNELIDLMIVDKAPEIIIGQIDSILYWLRDGRNLVVRMCDPAEMGHLIAAMQPHKMVFHSRVALTDGTWLVVFRKWTNEMNEDRNTNIKHVKHDLIAPARIGNNDQAHTYVGNKPSQYYDSDRDYSIQVWQRYASPVWFDLDELPSSHPNIWMDIRQTNVLNYRAAREQDDEKHICPLQIDVIEKCILDYTQPSDVVASSFAGIGSELVTAIRLNRAAYGSELKRSYYEMALKNLHAAEQRVNSPTLFDYVSRS